MQATFTKPTATSNMQVQVQRAAPTRPLQPVRPANLNTPTRILQQQQQQQVKPEPVVAAAARTSVVPLLVEQQAGQGMVVETLSLGQLAAMAAEGRLQMQEEDTSNMVYNSRKMASSLVVPVLQGKATPPIVLEAAAGAGTGLQVRGGSQRLRSLLAFVSGSSSIGGQHWPSAPVELDSRDGAFIRWNGKRFSQLPEATRAQVAQYPINCVIVKPAQA